MNTNYWKNKRVLITGAGGFVGSNALHFFHNKGAHVVGTIREEASEEKLELTIGKNWKDFDLKTVDLLNPDHVEDVVRGVDIILNFAALDGSLDYKQKYTADLFSSNIRINLNLLDQAVRSNIEHFLLVSSADIYTPTNGDPITEQTPIEVNWKRPVDGYKLSKWVSELSLREYVKQYGLKATIVRPSNLYGPRDDFSNLERLRFIPSVIRKSLIDKSEITLWGKGDQVRSYLYIDDFLTIISLLIEKGDYKEPVNIASRNNISLMDLANIISKKIDTNVPIVTLADKPAGAQARIFDLQLLKSIIELPEETPLNTGIDKTIDYVQKNIKTIQKLTK